MQQRFNPSKAGKVGKSARNTDSYGDYWPRKSTFDLFQRKITALLSLKYAFFGEITSVDLDKNVFQMNL